MRRVQLTRGLTAIVDDQDYQSISRYSWYAAPHKKTFYATRRETYSPNKSRIVYMHRILTGATPGRKVDHRDRDGLNNRRFNLRWCTPTQNSMNRGPRKNQASKFKGVHFLKKLGKWSAQICLAGSREYLGIFRREVDAAKAYNRAAKRLFGRFAYINRFYDES